jgi:hypothetical protein
LVLVVCVLTSLRTGVRPALVIAACACRLVAAAGCTRRRCCRLRLGFWPEPVHCPSMHIPSGCCRRRGPVSLRLLSCSLCRIRWTHCRVAIEKLEVVCVAAGHIWGWRPLASWLLTLAT